MINNPQVIKDVIINTTYSLGAVAIALRDNKQPIPAAIIENSIQALAALITKENDL